MLAYKKIFVAGHRGMVGAAVCRRLQREQVEVLTASRDCLDLTDRASTHEYIMKHRPDAIVLAAARVGGIVANNSYPVEFLTDNVRIAINTIEAAYQAKVPRLLFLGSTCIYPRLAPQPIREDSLLTSPLEQTNEAYALAKIAGLKLCEYYRRQYGAMFHSAMPTNLYGPGDNYHPQHSHVLPALIRRFYEAKLQGLAEVVIWGTGTPRREFLYVDDLADALVHLLGLVDPPDWVNVGTGIDHTILELATMIAEVVGYQGRISTDPSKPDGTPRKLTDSSKLHATGWRHSVDLRRGLELTFQAYLAEEKAGNTRNY